MIQDIVCFYEEMGWFTNKIYMNMSLQDYSHYTMKSIYIPFVLDHWYIRVTHKKIIILDTRNPIITCPNL